MLFFAHNPRSPAQLRNIQAGEAFISHCSHTGYLWLALTCLKQVQREQDTPFFPPSTLLKCKSKYCFSSSAQVFFFFPSWGFAKAHLNSSVPVPVQWPVNALCCRDMLPLHLNVESFLQKYPYLMKLEKHGQYRANKSICMWTLTGIKLAHLLPQLFAGRFLFCCRAAKFPLSTISVAAFYVSLHDTTQCKL